MFTQSLKINPRIPAVISNRSNMARKIAYAANRAVFSRNAPTHPVNPMRNVIAPLLKIKRNDIFYQNQK